MTSAPMAESSKGVVLELLGVSKRFGALTALEDISFSLYAGETLALLGDNGAGKSTLVKCLSGVYQFDEGELLLDGEVEQLRSPTDAQRLGIDTVFQDLALFDNLPADANIFAGRELAGIGRRQGLGFLWRKRMRDQAAAAVDEMRVAYKRLDMPVSLLSGGQRQVLAIARAQRFARRFIMLDEPTAALGLRESGAVLDYIASLPARGISTIIVSHNLEHVARVADRAVVLRQGKLVGEVSDLQANRELLVSLIVGSSVSPTVTGSANDRVHSAPVREEDVP
jgi:D-xylose transport system ATP-binding protein